MNCLWTERIRAAAESVGQSGDARVSRILKKLESSVGGRSVRWVQLDISNADQVPMPIEAIKTGMTLAVERDGGTHPFRVQRINLPMDGSLYTLTSEPVGFSDPWVISGPPGTMVIRLVRKQ